MKQNLEILAQAQTCFLSLATFRRDRERNKRYHYGNQWSDKIEVEGRLITEAQFLRSQGSEPLKNNLIRRLVRNVIGVNAARGLAPRCRLTYRSDKAAAQAIDSLLRYNASVNRLDSLLMRSLEEFLISGMAVHRKWYGTRQGRTECWTDFVSPECVFFDLSLRDFRTWDCRIVGEVHDIAFADACTQFAKSPADIQRLRAIYDHQLDLNETEADWQQFGIEQLPSPSFLMPRHQGMCRVIEVWRREVVSQVPPSGKWALTPQWHYYFLTPQGDVLSHGISPYAHGTHPYVFKAYPLIDGEIHSFVSDVIDQQRYINRLITMYDWMVRASAKGVLLLPTACIPHGTDPRDMARVWSKFNGVMVYASNDRNDVPKQVANASANSAISDLLGLQMKFFEDISGVNGALQGNLANNAMSARLFNQQTQNATTALTDVLDSFNQFVIDGAYKDTANMIQYYAPERIASIANLTKPIPLSEFEYNLEMLPSNTNQSKDNNEIQN